MISNIGFRVVMLYKTWGEGYDLLKEEISNDREGYVIRFKNGLIKILVIYFLWIYSFQMIIQMILLVF